MTAPDSSNAPTGGTSNAGASAADRTASPAGPADTATANGRVTMATANGVARIEFHHPKGNALPGTLLRELADAVRAAGDNPAVRVIALRSGGDGPFCAGASFDELTAIETPEQGREFFSGFARVILAMIRAPKFVVTRVHGKAAGGAVGLIAASDFSHAVRAAWAKLSELAVGIGPFVVGPVIERKIGLAAFGAMAVDADWRDAEWCERHGLYARLHADAHAMDAALDAQLDTLAASNPEAMARLKQVFWAGTEGWDALLAERAAMSGTLVLSAFTRQAIARFRAR
jgi:methylglutaconyl-CoA hydratase